MRKRAFHFAFIGQALEDGFIFGAEFNVVLANATKGETARESGSILTDGLTRIQHLNAILIPMQRGVAKSGNFYSPS
jgi:hypothetical protein